MRRTSSTAALAIAAVVAGLAVVVLASRGAPGDRTAAAFETASTGRTLFLSVLGVAFVVSAVLAAWSLWPDGSAVVRPPPRFRWLPYIAITVLIFVLAMFAPERRATEGFTDDSQVIDGRPRDAAEEGRPVFDGRASATASLALVAIAVTALVAYTVAGRVRRAREQELVDAAGEDPGGARSEPALDDHVVAELHAGGLDGALAAVRDEPDPRRAVLLAYAALEARLATTAAARLPAATPQEWLRAVRQVFAADHAEVAAAAQQLTALYERARFAVSPIDDSEKARSVAALEGLRSLPVGDRAGGRVR